MVIWVDIAVIVVGVLVDGNTHFNRLVKFNVGILEQKVKVRVFLQKLAHIAVLIVVGGGVVVVVVVAVVTNAVGTVVTITTSSINVTVGIAVVGGNID